MNFTQTLYALGLLLVTATPFAGEGAVHSPQDLDALLARPLSPGVIALLVDRGTDRRVVEVVSNALRDARPEVRAMAARFAAIRKVTPLDTVVREALRGETDLFAAREQVRAIGILGAGPSDPDLLAAAHRLGHGIADVVTETLVRHHRARGLRTYLDDLRTLAPSRFLLTWAIEEATRLDPGARRELAVQFLEASDAAGWLSLLAVEGENDDPVDHDVHLSALRHADPTIRDSTVWLLVARLPGKALANPAEWLAAMDEGVVTGDRATDSPEVAFGRQLLGRILGRPSGTDEAWVQFVRDAQTSRLDTWDAAEAAYPYLMKKELKVLQKRYKQRYGSAILPRPKRSPPQPSIGPAIRVVSDYPRGLVPDLIQVTGCEAPVGAPALVEADATFDADGRPVKVTLLSRPPGEPCLNLAVGLFAASLPPSRHVPKPEAVERLLLFLEDGWLRTLDEQKFEDWSVQRVGLTEDLPEVSPPKRIRFVKPAYPKKALESRAEGKVIMEMVVTSEGIVKAIRVLKVTNTAFLRNALWAVAQWRYDPARVGGRPLPVLLTVIVEFNLK